MGGQNYNPLPDVVISAVKDSSTLICRKPDENNLKSYIEDELIDGLCCYSAVNQGQLNKTIVNAIMHHLKNEKIPTVPRSIRHKYMSAFLLAATSVTGVDRVVPKVAGVEAPELMFKLARRWGYVKKGIPKDRAIIVRPHLIVGPGDRTDRWTYWPVRINRGGEVLAPGDPSQPAQYIDARDLSEFDIHLIENNLYGTYTAVGPLGNLTMSEMLYGIKAVVSNKVSFEWVDQNFILDNKIKPWTEMTAWMPSGGEFDGFCSFENSNAVKAGIKYRPLAVTARDTLEWWQTLPDERTREPKAGLSITKEKKVLKKWKSKIK